MNAIEKMGKLEYCDRICEWDTGDTEENIKTG